MSSIFKKPRDLSKELNCSWGDKKDLYLLYEDLSVEENLTLAMTRFPMLKKLIKKHHYSLQEIERCKNECHMFILSDGDNIWQLKEFFRHWLLPIY